MKRLCVQVLLLSVLTGSAVAGNLTFLTSPGSAIDTVNWSGIGPDSTLFSNGGSVASAHNNQTNINLGTQPALGGLTSVVCPAVNPVNCSWSNQTTGYAAGDTLIWLEGVDNNSNFVGTGPLSLSLQHAVGGLGSFIQATSSGAFSASLAVYNGAAILGSHSYSSDAAGDPLFLGVQDTATEITKAVITVTLCGSFACDANDFSADTLQIYSAAAASATPEPATFALGGTLLAIGLMVRKRSESESK